MTAPDAGSRSATVLGVTGGSAGLAATYDAVQALAADFDATGARLGEWSADDAQVLADPDLLASAALSPATFAVAEAATAAATGALLPAAAQWHGDALLVRAAVAGLQAGDAVAAAAVGELDRRLGVVAGLALRTVGPMAAAAAAGLPPEARARLGAAVDDWVGGHPAVVEHAASGGGGLLAGLAAAPALLLTGRQGARLLATAYADGRPVTTRRADLSVPSGRVPPGSVRALVSHLREVAALSPEADSVDNGTLEVQTLDAGTDRVRHIVYLPGTDDLTTRPWTQDQDVRDLGTCLRSDGGGPTAYQRGILQAMHDAGIGPHDPVLLVGHSLGGMEAAALASHDTGFHVTDVVTAGSPTAQVGGFPDDVHALSLEERGDPVPRVDGAPNPDTVEQVTVTFDDRSVGALDAHTYPHYVAGAAAVDASSDPSVVDAVARLRERGFLSGAGTSPHVTTQLFQVVRAR